MAKEGRSEGEGVGILNLSPEGRGDALREAKHIFRIVFGFYPSQSGVVCSVVNRPGIFNSLVRNVDIGPDDERLELPARVANKGDIFGGFGTLDP